jgi:prolipoprotein diacylglyceryl transferase
VWHIGPVPLRAYALCIIAGIVAALIIGDRRWVARGGQTGVIYDIALWAVPFGLIGGRLYHVMTDWRTYFGADGAGFGAALRIWDGGLGIWGAVALGALGAWIGCRQRGIPLPAFGDAIAPGIILAQAIGRLGNYFNQELYGRATTLPWGLEIYERRNSDGVLDSLNGVSTGQLVEVVHPTFLYELLWNLLVFAALLYVDRRFKIGHGRLFALYVAAYCVGRFWVELMRSDMATHIAGIRINTFTSTFVFIAAVVYIMVAPKGREDPESLKGNDEDDGESPIDEIGEELVAVAATSGVVAAATVAGAEDSGAKGDAAPATAMAAAVGDAEDQPEDAEGEPEDIDDVPDTDDAEPASTESGPMSEQAEDMAAEPEDESEGEPETEAAAEEALESEAGEPDEDEDEPEEVDDEPEAVEAEPEPEAAVEGAAEAEAVAEAEPDTSEPEDGLGSVEGDEVVAAEQDAPEVHEAAVEGAEVAEAVAEQVAAEAAPAESEPESTEAEAEAAAEAEDAEAEQESGEAAEPDASEPEDGLGSVEGDEVVAAEQDAPEVHEAAVEGAEEAEAVAEDVAAEAEQESGEAAEPDASEPEDGLGSVEGDEQAETVAEPAPQPAPEPRPRWWRRRR